MDRDPQFHEKTSQRGEKKERNFEAGDGKKRAKFWEGPPEALRMGSPAEGVRWRGGPGGRSPTGEKKPLKPAPTQTPRTHRQATDKAHTQTSANPHPILHFGFGQSDVGQLANSNWPNSNWPKSSVLCVPPVRVCVSDVRGCVFCGQPAVLDRSPRNNPSLDRPSAGRPNFRSCSLSLESSR